MKKRDLALAFGGAVGAAVAVKMLTRAATVNWEDIADKVAHSDHSHFVNVDGVRMHFQEFGDAAKPPMILIHGYTASVYVWKSVAPMLADNGFRVIAVDLVGFGWSEKPASFEYSIQAQARMISRFMNTLGIGRAIIVGNSYGGAVALNLTLDYPEMVEKLVVVDSVTNDAPKDHPVLKIVALRGIGEVLTPFVADSKLFLRARMHNTLAPANHHLITEERMNAIRRPLHAADGHRSLLATSRNWKAKRIEQDAHLINQPTLIIWGDQDNVIPIKCGHTLHKEILNSRFVVLKDCGHVPPEEKSDLFTKLVSEFCRDKKGRLKANDSEGIVMQPAT
ncbi:MAG: alpha/beta hydrolase [Chloracidobacterium sp.]|nr:alpha/beta hydrolase [Chloracidobacterium sp.]